MDKLIKEEFFKEFSINEDYFLSTGLDWTELEKIYEDYVSLVPLLEKEAEYVVSKLIDVSSVHSVRRRVKKPSHLIEKIIRKGKKYQERNISVDNYKEIVTDLIGIRVLHLFKDDWQTIHHEILNLWDIKETPQVNIRRGDYNLSQFKETIKDINCDVIVREHGYRSVHYLVSIDITKVLNISVEIQVRTVFEEAWSEIDHIMRYPYDVDNPIITEYLGIFNRIVGSADEMGTFLKKVKENSGNVKNVDEVQRELDLILSNDKYREDLMEIDLKYINKKGEPRNKTPWMLREDVIGIIGKRLQGKMPDSWYVRILYHNIISLLKSRKQQVEIYEILKANAYEIDTELRKKLTEKKLFPSKAYLETLATAKEVPGLPKKKTFILDFAASDKQMFRVGKNGTSWEVKIYSKEEKERNNLETQWIEIETFLPIYIREGFKGDAAKPQFYIDKTRGKFVCAIPCKIEKIPNS